MSRTYKDAFGVEINDGDTIVTTSNHSCVIGIARIRPNSLAVEFKHTVGWTNGYRMQQAGAWRVVLRSASGKVPYHIFTSIFGDTEKER